jgi:hypothetical protein
MNTEFINQYGHTWRVFERLVKDFEPDAWLYTGRGAITPARLALHILQATRYYIQDSATVPFASGKSFESNWITSAEENLPSQDDILGGIHEMQLKTDQWLSAMNLCAENASFPWAGKTKLGVAIFLLRHSLYHLGELSSLLNESKNGVAEDNYVKAI